MRTSVAQQTSCPFVGMELCLPPLLTSLPPGLMGILNAHFRVCSLGTKRKLVWVTLVPSFYRPPLCLVNSFRGDFPDFVVFVAKVMSRVECHISR